MVAGRGRRSFIPRSDGGDSRHPETGNVSNQRYYGDAMIRALLLGTAVLFFLASVPPSFYLMGPLIEANLFPVIKIEAIDVRTQLVVIDEKSIARVYFKTSSYKYEWRDYCKLDSFSWHWVFDNSSEPAEVRDALTEEIFRPTTRSPGHRTSRALFSDIPDVAYGFTSVKLTGTAFFSCHANWLLAYDVSIDVTIPSAEPLPLPVAEPE